MTLTGDADILAPLSNLGDLRDSTLTEWVIADTV